jgi:acyl-CoA thioester hydrolase
LTTQETFVGEIRLRVRYAETDAMGIAHHGSYIVYFEEGRTHYLRQRGGNYAAFERSGFYLAVTEVNARYIKAARYDQEIIVRCWITEMKSRTLTFDYAIVDAASHELLVTGFSKHLCITHDWQVTRLPDEWRAWFAG